MNRKILFLALISAITLLALYIFIDIKTAILYGIKTTGEIQHSEKLSDLPADDKLIETPEEELPLLAVIIDDFGLTMNRVRDYMELDFKINFSVMPDRPFTKRIVKLLKENNKTVMLHQPMEPMGYPRNDPGAAAVFVSMSDKEIRELINKNIKNINPVAVNNHMGSRATADKRVMRAVLSEIKKNNLIFIDSYTTPNSVILDVADELGVRALRNDVFLDNIDDINHIEAQFNKAVNIALKRGYAVCLGHIQKKNTLLFLKRLNLNELNVKIVAVDDLLDAVK